MNPPFTLEQFLTVFEDYNVAVFPMQIILYLFGAAAVFIAIRPTPNSDRIISILLSFLWVWMGVAYHIIFFTAINPAAYVFGGLFILQGLLFFVFGVVQNRFSFHFRKKTYGFTGMVLLIYALIIYPVLGYSLDHNYPSSPSFGLPCPTTIFTFGLLLLNINKCPISILIIPIIWSIIGFTAALKFGFWEDTGLLASGAIATLLLIYRNGRL